MINEQKGDKEIKIPTLFSFITLRREVFGGILFNPFLPSEIELDTTETFMCEMCNGTHSVKDIISESRVLFNMPVVVITKKWDELINKLKKAHAIQFVNDLRPSSIAPDTTNHNSNYRIFSAPKNIIWDITYACNLNCLHCLTNSGRHAKKGLATEKAHKIIDIIAASKVLYLSLTGGEPFLRKDILELLSHIAHTGMRVDIATNGYMISKQIINNLYQLPVFQIQVSIDGIGDLHDKFRGKVGAFDKACESLRIFKGEGISTSVSMTVTSQNIDHLERVINLAFELGCDGFKAIPFIPAGRGRIHNNMLRLDKKGSEKLTRTLIKKRQELIGQINISTESTFLFLINSPSESIHKSDNNMICSAGYDQLSIDADGTAYPCPFLHDFPLGNLLTDSMDEIWHESKILKEIRSLKKYEMTGPCRTCEYATQYCRGGCRASSYFLTGSLKGSDPLCFKDIITRNKVSRCQQ